MKITEIKDLQKPKVQLVRPFRIALGLITHAVSCLVEMRPMTVLPGYGEDQRDRLITGENLEGTIATIERLKGEAYRHGPAGDMEATIWTEMNRTVAYDGTAKEGNQSCMP